MLVQNCEEPTLCFALEIHLSGTYLFNMTVCQRPSSVSSFEDHLANKALFINYKYSYYKKRTDMSKNVYVFQNCSEYHKTNIFKSEQNLNVNIFLKNTTKFEISSKNQKTWKKIILNFLVPFL